MQLAAMQQSQKSGWI